MRFNRSGWRCWKARHNQTETLPGVAAEVGVTMDPVARSSHLVDRDELAEGVAGELLVEDRGVGPRNP
jgi:hypothetical protein